MDIGDGCLKEMDKCSTCLLAGVFENKIPSARHIARCFSIVPKQQRYPETNAATLGAPPTSGSAVLLKTF